MSDTLPGAAVLFAAAALLAMPSLIMRLGPTETDADTATANSGQCHPDCSERCDTCSERMCAQYGPEPAITCDAHRICTGCDDYSHQCRACAEAREAATYEDAS